MNKIEKLILILLIVILAISSYFLFKKLEVNNKEVEVFEDLQEIIENNNEETNENQFTSVSDDEENKSSKSSYNLKNVVQINSDVIGWIKIDGTNIDYPIMQNENYYLKHDIYKNYSSHGTPYLANYCNLENSDNLIIFGHHMNDNTMFSGLEYYKNYSFYKNHKYIKFYLIENEKTIENTYEIVTTFKTVAYTEEGFKYYSYTNFKDEEEFKEYKDKCNTLEFYKTDTEWNVSDKYITLSTCEYSQKNGRMVIVAKKL